MSSVKVPPDTGQGAGSAVPAAGAPAPGAPQGTCLVASGPVTVTTIPGPGPAIGTNGKGKTYGTKNSEPWTRV